MGLIADGLGKVGGVVASPTIDAVACSVSVGIVILARGVTSATTGVGVVASVGIDIFTGEDAALVVATAADCLEMVVGT